MELNWEGFKNGGIRVHCTTEEDAKKFIDMCYENGIYWYFYNNYETYWSTYKKNTYYACANGKLGYGDISCSFCAKDYRETYEFKDVTNINIEEDNKMELKEGMIIECRNGDRYLLRTACGELVASSNYKYMNLDYDEELNENKYFDKDFDVMKVYTSEAFVLSKLFDDNYLECIWERKEPKKMTLAQISEALGYEVEVIDNE